MNGQDRDKHEDRPDAGQFNDMGQGSFEESFGGAKDQPASGQGPGMVSAEHHDDARSRPGRARLSLKEGKGWFGAPSGGGPAEQGGMGRKLFAMIGGDPKRKASATAGTLDRIAHARARADQERTAARTAACREAQLAHEKLARAHEDLAAELARSASQRSTNHGD